MPWLSAAALLCLAACASEPGEPSPAPPWVAPVDAAVAMFDAAHSPVGDEDGGPSQEAAQPPPEGDPYLGLAAPPSGLRLHTVGRELPPHTDSEYCEVAELPGGPDQEYVVNRLEAANGRASHHLIVLVAKPGSPADKKLRTLEPGYQTPCIAANIEFGEGLTSIAGAQTPYSDLQFPEGVGIKLRGGQRVVFDYHYFNYFDYPITARSALAIHTLPAERVHTLANGFAFTNMTIDTPPGGRSTFTATCSFKRDVMVMNVNRHTHQQSTAFDVWFEGGTRHGQHIWTSLDWEHDGSHRFEQPTLVRAGEGFRFACSFENASSKALRFGIMASDEMCILNGTIWSPTPSLEEFAEDCVITWTDPEGIGRDSKAEPGPTSTLEDALSCHLTTFGFALLDSCVGCVCDSCASVLSRCGADPDCKPLLDCRTSCTAQENCDEKCEPLMFKHSSAVGMITQVGLCMSDKCGAHCAPGGS